MYVVMLGSINSELGEKDFTAHGPFASEEAAQQWIDELQEKLGVDPLDMPVVVNLYDPAEYLRELE